MNASRTDTDSVRRDHPGGRARWSAAVTVLGLVFLLGATESQKVIVTDEIRAEKIILVDRAGKVRAGLTVGPDGKVGLALTDPEGKIRAGLGVASDGSPGLALADKDGVRRAGLSLGADGAVRFDLTDGSGKPRAELAVLNYGSPALFLRNTDGTIRALFGFMGDVTPTITLTDGGGRPRAELAVTDAGLPHLAILDKDEKGSAWLTVSQDGSPALQLRDKEGNTRALQVADLSREGLERVAQEKRQGESERASRDLAFAKLELTSVTDRLAEMQKQVDRLQQELASVQQKQERERRQEAARREEAERHRKDVSQLTRRVEELGKASEEQDYVRMVNEALAYTYRSQAGDEERAEAAYRKAVDLAKAKNLQDPLVYNAYAVFLQQRQRFEEAENFYKQALEVNPSYGKALYNLGTLYESRGELEQALEKYKAADEAGVPQGRESYLRLQSVLNQ